MEGTKPQPQPERQQETRDESPTKRSRGGPSALVDVLCTWFDYHEGGNTVPQTDVVVQVPQAWLDEAKCEPERATTFAVQLDGTDTAKGCQKDFAAAIKRLVDTDTDDDDDKQAALQLKSDLLIKMTTPVNKPEDESAFVCTADAVKAVATSFVYEKTDNEPWCAEHSRKLKEVQESHEKQLSNQKQAIEDAIQTELNALTAEKLYEQCNLVNCGLPHTVDPKTKQLVFDVEQAKALIGEVWSMRRNNDKAAVAARAALLKQTEAAKDALAKEFQQAAKAEAERLLKEDVNKFFTVFKKFTYPVLFAPFKVVPEGGRKGSAPPVVKHHFVFLVCYMH